MLGSEYNSAVTLKYRKVETLNNWGEMGSCQESGLQGTSQMVGAATKQDAPQSRATGTAIERRKATDREQ